MDLPLARVKHAPDVRNLFARCSGRLQRDVVRPHTGESKRFRDLADTCLQYNLADVQARTCSGATSNLFKHMECGRLELGFPYSSIRLSQGYEALDYT